MEERRKFANKPDPSYDLDGDGIVSNRDMFLSKLFDKDRDGKLNPVERKNAEEAIRNVSSWQNGLIYVYPSRCVKLKLYLLRGSKINCGPKASQAMPKVGSSTSTFCQECSQCTARKMS